MKIIVPRLARRGAVSGEGHWGIHLARGGKADHLEIDALLQSDCLPSRPVQHERVRARKSRPRGNRKRLEVAAVCAGRLESRLLEFAGNVIGSKIDAPGRDAAAFA